MLSHKAMWRLLQTATLLLLVACLFVSCVPAAYADDLDDTPAEALADAPTDIPADTPSEAPADTPEENPVSIMEYALEEAEEEKPDAIPDDLFKSYVLGCLFFFVIVIVAYFSCKFFAMFF